MTKRINRPAPIRTDTLECCQTTCPQCGGPTWQQYTKRRTVVTLEGVIQLGLKVRICQTPTCRRYHKAYRPEAEGRFVLPQHEFGLDLITQIGAWRYREHRSVPEMHAMLRARDLPISERTVTNLLTRYDELVALSVLDVDRLRRITQAHGRVILALDGLQPDVGHEILWVVRDCLSGEIVLVRSLLSATETDLATLLDEVRDALEVPIAAVISDGQHSIRKAVARALPDVPHQLCHFHYLREAATPVFAADRHAKKELKKRVRGIRPLERAVEDRDDPAASIVRGYAVAVRSALTDDGIAPLDAPGLRLQERLTQIQDSLQRVEEPGRHLPELGRIQRIIGAALAETAPLWEPIRRAYRWVRAAAHVLANHENLDRAAVHQAFAKVLRSIGVTKRHCGPLEEALTHFLKVTRSYRPGLFHCYDDDALPRTNNDLEHCFGQHRHHERRATGCKTGAPNAVLHGAVRLVAGVATRLRQFTPDELVPHDRDRWAKIRHAVRQRFALRAQGRRFRRAPEAYLTQLEEDCLKLPLPT